MTAPVNTTFTTGTTITSEWLNGVNDYVNELDPADHSSANITYQPAGTGAQVTTVQTKLRESVSVKDFGAVGDGVTDDSVAIQNAINAADVSSGIVNFGSGTFLINTGISLVGKHVTLQGAGIDNTIIKAGSSMVTMIDAVEASDVQVTPYNIYDLTIDGDNLATNAIYNKYRHHTNITNVYIVNCDVALRDEESWLNYRENIRTKFCQTGFQVFNSSANQYNRCTVTEYFGYGIQVGPVSTTGDLNNVGILFSACDVEFATSTAPGIYINAASVTLDTCYLGEVLSGTTIVVQEGVVTMTGGMLQYDYVSTNTGIDVRGGKIILDGVWVKCQGTDESNLARKDVSTVAGKIQMTNCRFSVDTSSPLILVGDLLDFGPSYDKYAPKRGREYTVENSNVTVTSSVTSNGKTVTATSGATGSPAYFGLYASLNNYADAFHDALVYLVVIYSSNTDMNIILSNGSGGSGTILSLGTLPNTSGNVRTAVFAGSGIDNNNYTTIEFYKTTGISISDTLSLQEVYFADASMVNSSPGNLSNLYKC